MVSCLRKSLSRILRNEIKLLVRVYVTWFRDTRSWSISLCGEVAALDPVPEFSGQNVSAALHELEAEVPTGQNHSLL